MLDSKEIEALFNLIDDPDHEVFTTVSDRIVCYGRSIIPNLENLWETTISEEVQDRIEMLIHRLHFSDLVTDFTEWRNSAYHDLLFGALLVARFQYPDLQTAPVIQEIEKIRRNVWLELNSFLTPLEQANVITSIVYNYYNLKGSEVSYNNPDEFLLHKVIQLKKGNTISNGVLYLVLAELLSIPVKAINIPQQFVLAFFSNNTQTESTDLRKKISFYVDATTGQVFGQKEIDNYLARIALPASPHFFLPMNHKEIIQLLICEFGRCFESPEKVYKKNELLQLAELLQQ